MTQRLRLDKLLVERHLVESRQRAVSLILSGYVYVDGKPAQKAGQLVSSGANIFIKEAPPYVSRGGLKLEKALQEFHIHVQGKIGMDIGASTGGFTDCLLQHGAKKVYAIDVGYGQLHWRLRRDPRVINFEKTHILKFDWTRIKERIDIITIDLSFISLKKVLPLLKEHLTDHTKIIALVKPQFEARREEIKKGGTVKDRKIIERILEEIITYAETLGYILKGLIPSPIPGQKKGNIEYLLYLET